MNRIKNKKIVLAFIPFYITTSCGLTCYAESNSFNQNYFEYKAIKTNNILDNINISIKDFGCSEAINKLLSNIEYNLNEYNLSNNLAYLEKSMELFGEIAIVSTEDDLKYFEGETIVYNFFDSIRSSIYSINDKDVSGKYLVKFAREILFGWRKNKISEIYPENYLVIGLVEYNEDKIEDVQPILNDLKISYHYMVNNEEENTDSEDLPGFEEKPDYEIKPLPPGYGGEGNNSSNNSSSSESKDDIDGENFNSVALGDNINSSSYYKKKGNTCILVETKYKEGIIFEQGEKSVPKEDYVYCGIYDYVFDGVESAINNNTTVIIDEDYLLNTQNEDSDRFIFYTVTKNEAIPYYYNSGIRVNSDGVVSYNQLKDALYQIAIKIDGFSTDSNYKSLFIADGIPIVLTSEKNIYLKQEVESLLDSFKRVDLKIEKELTSLSNGLEEIIENKDMILLKYKDKEFILSDLYINDLNIMAPIQEIVGHFGYKTDINQKQLLVSKKDYELKLTLNKKTYSLNGEEGEFKTSITKKNSEWYAEIGKMMELIGYDIKWDSEGLYFDVIDMINEDEYIE